MIVDVSVVVDVSGVVVVIVDVLCCRRCFRSNVVVIVDVSVVVDVSAGVVVIVECPCC